MIELEPISFFLAKCASIVQDLYQEFSLSSVVLGRGYLLQMVGVIQGFNFLPQSNHLIFEHIVHDGSLVERLLDSLHNFLLGLLDFGVKYLIAFLASG